MGPLLWLVASGKSPAPLVDVGRSDCGRSESPDSSRQRRLSECTETPKGLGTIKRLGWIWIIWLFLPCDVLGHLSAVQLQVLHAASTSGPKLLTVQFAARVFVRNRFLCVSVARGTCNPPSSEQKTDAAPWAKCLQFTSGGDYAGSEAMYCDLLFQQYIKFKS
eukprot:s474_g6.t1